MKLIFGDIALHDIPPLQLRSSSAAESDDNHHSFSMLY
jgi:hypothetical protein